jgi:hypothetical protein
MLLNLTLGTLLVTVTVLIHMLGLMALTRLTEILTGGISLDRRRAHMLAMVAIVLGIVVVLGVEIWVWTAAYVVLGLFPDLFTALYFSISTFCTLGYGDIVPPERWRVFAALEGVNGFLLIGWSTAYLIAVAMRIGPFRSGEHF